MDGFAFHPYPASSSIPPDRPTDPESTSILMADYEEKLRPLAGRGVRSRPAGALQRAGRRDDDSGREGSAYQGEEVGRPVDETTQADFYRRAIALAACQENVAGLLLFHSHDEPALHRLPVRRLLRRRHAEGELRAGARGGRGACDMPVSEAPQGGQYVAYSFHKVDPAWRRLPVEERSAMKDAFAEVVEGWGERFEHCAPTRPRASAPTATSSSGRSPSATRIWASSAPH